jgi:hypothetical protein
MSGFLPILTTVTAADVATAVRVELATELAMVAALPTLAEIESATIPVNIKKVNNVTITGTGVPTTDEWRPA